MAVLLETSKGDLVVDLHTDDCPITSRNFLKLCKCGALRQAERMCSLSWSDCQTMAVVRYDSVMRCLAAQDQVLQQLPLPQRAAELHRADRRPDRLRARRGLHLRVRLRARSRAPSRSPDPPGSMQRWHSSAPPSSLDCLCAGSCTGRRRASSRTRFGRTCATSARACSAWPVRPAPARSAARPRPARAPRQGAAWPEAAGGAGGGENLNASQFYITTGVDLDSLDDKHTVFGEVLPRARRGLFCCAVELPAVLGALATRGP